MIKQQKQPLQGPVPCHKRSYFNSIMRISLLDYLWIYSSWFLFTFFEAQLLSNQCVNLRLTYSQTTVRLLTIPLLFMDRFGRNLLLQEDFRFLSDFRVVLAEFRGSVNLVFVCIKLQYYQTFKLKKTIVNVSFVPSDIADRLFREKVDFSTLLRKLLILTLFFPISSPCVVLFHPCLT